MKRLLTLIPVIAIAAVAQSRPGQSPETPPPALPPSSPVELPTPEVYRLLRSRHPPVPVSPKTLWMQRSWRRSNKFRPHK
jgi:hypothetical protein